MPQPPMGNGVNDRSTPRDLFDKLNAEFRFTLDAAASHENALVGRYCTLSGMFHRIGRGWYQGSLHDGLKFQWSTLERVFINPPYGRGLLEPFIRKAAERSAEVTVALVPVRTEQPWFHQYVWDERTHTPRTGVEIRFMDKRLKFGGLDQGAAFPSMLVVFYGVDTQARTL